MDFPPPDHLTLKPGLELFPPNWWNSVKCENGALAAVSAQLRLVVATVFLKFYKHNPGPLFDHLFGALYWGGPPPQERLRLSPRCPATPASGGKFKKKIKLDRLGRGQFPAEARHGSWESNIPAQN